MKVNEKNYPVIHQFLKDNQLSTKRFSALNKDNLGFVQNLIGSNPQLVRDYAASTIKTIGELHKQAENLTPQKPLTPPRARSVTPVREPSVTSNRSESVASRTRSHSSERSSRSPSVEAESIRSSSRASSVASVHSNNSEHVDSSKWETIVNTIKKIVNFLGKLLPGTKTASNDEETVTYRLSPSQITPIHRNASSEIIEENDGDNKDAESVRSDEERASAPNTLAVVNYRRPALADLPNQDDDSEDSVSISDISDSDSEDSQSVASESDFEVDSSDEDDAIVIEQPRSFFNRLLTSSNSIEAFIERLLPEKAPEESETVTLPRAIAHPALKTLLEKNANTEQVTLAAGILACGIGATKTGVALLIDPIIDPILNSQKPVILAGLAGAATSVYYLSKVAINKLLKHKIVDGDTSFSNQLLTKVVDYAPTVITVGTTALLTYYSGVLAPLTAANKYSFIPTTGDVLDKLYLKPKINPQQLLQESYTSVVVGVPLIALGLRLKGITQNFFKETNTKL